MKFIKMELAAAHALTKYPMTLSGENNTSAREPPMASGLVKLLLIGTFFLTAALVNLIQAAEWKEISAHNYQVFMLSKPVGALASCCFIASCYCYYGRKSWLAAWACLLVALAIAAVGLVIS